MKKVPVLFSFLIQFWITLKLVNCDALVEEGNELFEGDIDIPNDEEVALEDGAQEAGILGTFVISICVLLKVYCKDFT